MTRIVLATGNPHKVAEIEPMLSQAGFNVLPQSTFFAGEVEEDGMSFVENALKKARHASQKSGLPALADDSGIEIVALNGQPGIYSARYAANGQDKTTDEQNLTQVLKDLEGVPYGQRDARYSCAAVYVEHAEDPMPIIGIGHWYGDILMQRRTGGGIGYDDIMWIPQLVKTVSEVPIDVKNRISHRAKAINSVLAQLEEKERQWSN